MADPKDRDATRAAAASPAAKYLSKGVGRALAALEALRTAAEPLSLDDLSARLGVRPAPLHRILYTLETARYLERDRGGRYTVVQAFGLVAPAHGHRLMTFALPRMRELNCEVRETVSLAMRFGHHVEAIAVCESPHPIRMGNTIGRILPPHASSLGKAITAFQPEEARESLIRSYGLHRFTAHTIVDELELRRELDAIRGRGFSSDVEESALEGCCFGAPIRVSGRVVAAISLSMPKMRLTGGDRGAQLVGAVQRTADAITRDLQPSAPADGVRPRPDKG